MPHCCPVCSRPMDEPAFPLEALISMRLSLITAKQRKILEPLVKAYPNAIPTERIVNHVYADCSDGGPLWAHKGLVVTIYHLRRRLVRLGWEIISTGGKDNGSYRLALL